MAEMVLTSMPGVYGLRCWTGFSLRSLALQGSASSAGFACRNNQEYNEFDSRKCPAPFNNSLIATWVRCAYVSSIRIKFNEYTAHHNISISLKKPRQVRVSTFVRASATRVSPTPVLSDGLWWAGDLASDPVCPRRNVFSSM